MTEEKWPFFHNAALNNAGFMERPTEEMREMSIRWVDAYQLMQPENLTDHIYHLMNAAFSLGVECTMDWLLEMPIEEIEMRTGVKLQNCPHAAETLAIPRGAATKQEKETSE